MGKKHLQIGQIWTATLYCHDEPKPLDGFSFLIVARRERWWGRPDRRSATVRANDPRVGSIARGRYLWLASKVDIAPTVYCPQAWWFDDYGVAVVGTPPDARRFVLIRKSRGAAIHRVYGLRPLDVVFLGAAAD